MDKFSDWKKYVEKETDKARQDGRLREETPPKRAVPELDRDRFRIHRNQPSDTAGTDQKKNDAKNPVPDKTPASPLGKTQKIDPSNPLASPFISVQQVWEAAEKSSKSRQDERMKKESSKPVEQKQIPGMPRRSVDESALQESEEAKQNRKRGVQEQSREEILERLVNPTITLEEAAKIMGVCKATVRRYTAKGVLPHYRTPGNQRRFKLNDIINFLEEQRR